MVTSRLTYVEPAAALARALRLSRLTESDHEKVLRNLDRLWTEFETVEVCDDLVRRAAKLADTCELRGYDAVHCASAESFDDSDFVFASGDKKLLDACASLGMATSDVNHP